MRLPAFLFVAGAISTGASSAAQLDSFPLAKGVLLESGDSWSQTGKHYRLYGVQACLRGTLYTDRGGHRRDCGDASLAVLSANITDTHPVCAAVAETAATVYVACYAVIGADRLDLGNLMIASGFAFAALRGDGLPLHPPYAVSEDQARKRRVGLWQFEDVQHPAILLGQAGTSLDARQ
jgi:endonuclease YncB( thermonuclease family)